MDKTLYDTKTANEEIDESQIQNIELFEQFKEEFTCSICLGILKDPFMCSSCEVSFCKKCIDKWSEKNSSCPLKCTPLTLKAISISQKRLLDKILIKCKNGCIVSLLCYEKHICENKGKNVVCWNCLKSVVLQSDLEVTEISYKNMKSQYNDFISGCIKKELLQKRDNCKKLENQILKLKELSLACNSEKEKALADYLLMKSENEKLKEENVKLNSKYELLILEKEQSLAEVKSMKEQVHDILEENYSLKGNLY